MKNKTMTKKQKIALRCAFADLIGAVQAYNQGDYHLHDWEAHFVPVLTSIEDLKQEFDFLDEIPDTIYGGEL